MTRLMLMTFFGQKRWEKDVHPHESPAVMTVPLIVLAVLSVGGGALYFAGDWIVHWLEPVVGHEEHHPPVSALVMTLITVAVVAVGVAIAVPAVPPRHPARGAGPGLAGHHLRPP